jgi:hypothetical protein
MDKVRAGSPLILRWFPTLRAIIFLFHAELLYAGVFEEILELGLPVIILFMLNAYFKDAEA